MTLDFRRATGLVCLVALAVLVLWDVFAAGSGQDGATISEVVRGFGYAHPIVVFAAGVVVGHWFWGVQLPHET